MPALTLRNALPADAARCFEIEITAYEGDEAATREKIATRIATWPEGFIVAEVDGVVAGFINSGAAFQVEMSDEAFKELVGHSAEALNVVIMSVVVDPAHQGKGYSTLLMTEFVQRMRAMGKQTIHLMCKERHVPLYTRMGYRTVGIVERRAADLGFRTVFALSSQAYNFFVQILGYQTVTPDRLPPARREKLLRSGRNSRVLLRDLPTPPPSGEPTP